MTTLRITKHVRIAGKIECLTGLRIGGSKDEIEIGGMDNPIIRHHITRQPYIPGSSLKGKLRSTLEYAYGKVGDNGDPCNCALEDCPVCRLFGPHKKPKHGLGPTRLLVRDATLANFDINNPDKWVEAKTETAIDRSVGTARDPRPVERVASGAIFDFEISMRVFASDNEAKMLSAVREGFALLEEEYIGASGSRGYGKVRFAFESPTEWRKQD